MKRTLPLLLCLCLALTGGCQLMMGVYTVASIITKVGDVLLPARSVAVEEAEDEPEETEDDGKE